MKAEDIHSRLGLGGTFVASDAVGVVGVDGVLGVGLVLEGISSDHHHTWLCSPGGCSVVPILNNKQNIRIDKISQRAPYQVQSPSAAALSAV